MEKEDKVDHCHEPRDTNMRKGGNCHEPRDTNMKKGVTAMNLETLT